MKSFKAHSNTIYRIKILTNGYVVTASPPESNYNYYLIDRAEVKVWDATNNNWDLILNYAGHTLSVNALDYKDADTIVSGGDDKTIQIWLISTGETLRTIFVDSSVKSLKMLENGIHLAAGLSEKLNIYNIATGDLVSTLLENTNNIWDLLLINSDLLVSSGDSPDNEVRIWNLTTNTCKFILNGHRAGVYGLKQIKSDIIASASRDASIRLWNITNGKLIRILAGNTDPIMWSIDLLNDGLTFVSGSIRGAIKLWNWETGKCLSTIQSDSQIYWLAVYDTSKTSKYLLKISK